MCHAQFFVPFFLLHFYTTTTTDVLTSLMKNNTSRGVPRGGAWGATPPASENLLGFTMERPLLLKFCLNNHENLDYNS
jgi:hypothetical protein